MHQIETLRDVAHHDETPSPAAVYLARLAPGSRRAQAGALAWLAREASGGTCGPEDLPWHELRYEHTQALRARLAERYAPATANRHLAALRGVLHQVWRLGLMDAETYHRATDLERVRGARVPAGRSLAMAELAALFEVCGRDCSPAGARDAALLSVLYGGGLRRAEAASLDLADWTPTSGELRVRGKGSKERLVYATNGGRAALEAWVAVRGDAPGALLCPVDRCGRIEVRGLSEQSIYAALARRADEAGVAAFSPHDLRRTFISDALDAGADVSAVQALAGHANPGTTTRYDRRGERAKQRAAALLHVPYRPAATDRSLQRVPIRHGRPA